ncbi:MAG TPA: PfkB family carbohydrate kinase, partial [Chitinophagaceae bacterium]|nr:PfkB family carbohydrate kinase [Chitinophagaceae bacterium]
LYDEQGIRTEYIISSADRITTNKTRIISRNQQMLRLDAEITRDLRSEEEDQLIRSFGRFLAEEQPRIVILQDYNKGVLTARVIHSVIEACKKAGVLTAVDPKRKNFFAFRGVDLFKPNLKEVKDALNLILEGLSAEVLHSIHTELQQRLQHHISFITLSEKGVFYQLEDRQEWIPSHLRQIADVSGAGDTVIATAALVYAATSDVGLMARVANIAGGLVCEEVGTAAIRRDRLLQECNLLLG